MKIASNRIQSCKLLAGFFWIASLELLLAAALSLVIETDTKNAFLFGFSKTRLVLVAFLLGAAVVMGVLGTVTLKRRKLCSRLQCFFNSKPWIPIIPAVLAGAMGLSILYVNPSNAAFIRLAPSLLSFWLIGIEYTALSTLVSNDTREEYQVALHGFNAISRKLYALITIALIYASLLVPIGIPALFDGTPLNTPVEFITAALFIPFAVLIDWRYFSKRQVLGIALAILAARILLSFVAPLSGISVWVSQNENLAESDHWIPTYDTILHPTMSSRMTAPYKHIRNFPVEWINDKNIHIEQVGFTLRLDSYAQLARGERLIFITQGMERGEIELTDLETGQTVPAPLVTGAHPVDWNHPPEAPPFQRFRIQGTLIFRGAQPYQFHPAVLSDDGNIHNAFERGKLWCQLQGVELLTTQFHLIQFFQNLTGIALLATVLSGILHGLRLLHRQQVIQPIDLYLAASSIFGSAFLRLLDKPDLERIIPYGILCFGFLRLAISWITSGTRRLKTPTRPFLLSIGVAALTLFLFLDIHELQEIFIFPQGQDSLSYQIMARYIFVEGDFLLTHSRIPPHAYKLLFPYLVGILHIIFGQSSASLFFFNAWCGFLIAYLIVIVLERNKLPWILSFNAGLILLFVLTQPSFLVFFFRFGLIEPVATLGLVMVIYYLSDSRFIPALLTSILTVLFRLDYLGGIFAALILAADPLTGSFRQVWQSVFRFVTVKWKQGLLYSLALTALPLTAILFYHRVYPNYVLNARDTVQYSIYTILEGLLRIIIGGSPSELSERFVQNPLDAVIITAILVSGTLLGILTLLWRRGVIKQVDIRWSIVLLGLLSAYIPVKPTGYSPRFSTPLLPLVIIEIALFLHQATLKSKSFDS
ncbi:MAG: hypothetical protein WHV66_00685 [Anaerolineales bacterium]